MSAEFRGSPDYSMKLDVVLQDTEAFLKIFNDHPEYKAAAEKIFVENKLNSIEREDFDNFWSPDYDGDRRQWLNNNVDEKGQETFAEAIDAKLETL